MTSSSWSIKLKFVCWSQFSHYHCNKFQTNCGKKSPGRTYRFSHFMELESPKPPHTCPPLVHILSKINPAQTLPSYYFRVHFNTILSSTSRASKRYLRLRLPYQNPVGISVLPHTCRMPSTTSLSLSANIKVILLDPITQK